MAGYQLSAALLAAGTPIPMGFTLGPVITGSQVAVTLTPGYFALCRSPFHLQLKSWLDVLCQDTRVKPRFVYISHGSEDKGGRHVSLQL